MKDAKNMNMKKSLASQSFLIQELNIYYIKYM